MTADTIFAAGSLLRSQWFLDRYELAVAIPMTELWGDKAVLIFRKKSYSMGVNHSWVAPDVSRELS